MKQESVYKSEEGKRAILAVYDTILGSWPVPHEALEVETRHGRTFVIACGDKALPPLFLIHGSGSNAAMWIGDAAEYSRHFRVYAVDIPGEAGKSHDVRPDFRTQAHAEWLLDVFDALNVQKACIAGISLGGWVAVRFAAVYPDKAEKLVLLCPAGIGPLKVSPILRLIALKLKGTRGTEKAMDKISEGAQMPEEAMAYIRLITQHFNYYRGIVPRFSNAELTRLTMPVLLVFGEQDAMLNAKDAARRARKRLPNAETVLLPGAGHMLIDQRERALQFLLR
jgi:pimeloyl-ACP methyl ester carboxylesterase